MEKSRLLIAEGSETLRQTLVGLFQGSYQVRCCADGWEAQRILPDFQPDVMILDLMLPGLDGLSLLQWALDQGLRMQVLATTSFISHYVLEAAESLGVGYVMRKPYDISALADRVSDLAVSLPETPALRMEPASQVAGILLNLGIRPKLLGFACLKEAILLSAGDGGQSITKVLYPQTAKRCGCKSAQVERNIRNAITDAWSRRDNALWRMYFPADSTGSVPRPTNAVFISRLAEILRMEQAG